MAFLLHFYGILSLAMITMLSFCTSQKKVHDGCSRLLEISHHSRDSRLNWPLIIRVQAIRKETKTLINYERNIIFDDISRREQIYTSSITELLHVQSLEIIGLSINVFYWKAREILTRITFYDSASVSACYYSVLNFRAFFEALVHCSYKKACNSSYREI